MRTLLLSLAAVAALALAGTASAGGWATAGVGPPPDDPTAGSSWDAKITILQHGRTPLAGVHPTLTLTGAGGKRVTFPAEATDETGVYVAAVKFPSAGSWSYEVYDGFTQYGNPQRHTFGAISVGAGTGSGSSSDFPTMQVTLGVLLALGLGIALVLGMRRMRPRPAPQL
jgi:YtkA-like